MSKNILMHSKKNLKTCAGVCFGALSLALWSLPAMALDLQNTVLEVLSTTPQLKSAIEEQRALEGARSQARSAMFPNVRLGYRSGTRTTETEVDENDLDETELSLNLVQPLFSDGSLLGMSRYRAAQAQVLSGRSNVVSTVDALTLRTAELYLDILRSQDYVRISRDNLNSVYGVYSKLAAQARVDPGQRFLLFRADNRLSLAREEFANGERFLQIARVRMARLLGRDIGVLSEDERPRIPVELIPASKEAAVELAVGSHPAILAAQKEIDRLTAERTVARGAFLPRLDGVYEYSDSENTGGTEGEQTETFVGFSVSYNFDLAGGSFSQGRSADHRLRAAIERLETARRQVNESVEIAWESWRLLDQRLTALKQYTAANIKERNAYNQQFRAGQRTLIDLLNIEFEAFLARIRELQAQFERDSAVYQLLSATGQLTDLFLEEDAAIDMLIQGKSLVPQGG